jgi:V-type H+-transporting ATPase subunit A
MLRCIVVFYNCCQRAIADSPADAKITWAHIKTSMGPLIQKIIQTKFVVRPEFQCGRHLPPPPCSDVARDSQDPKESSSRITGELNGLAQQIEEAFQALGD